MALEEQLLETFESNSHILQLYGADRTALTANVSRYLHEGLRQGDHLLVIATPEHRSAFLQQLKLMGADPDTAERAGQIVWLDAAESLRQFMTGEQPDRTLFDSTIGATVRRIRSTSFGGRVRAYGDMVGILWESGQLAAALRVEALWNELLAQVGFRLYCSCPIDVSNGDVRKDIMEDLLCAHTRLMPVGMNGDADAALGLAVTLAKRFRALIENSSDAICLTNQQGTVIYASASNERVLGYAPGDLLGRKVIEFIHPEDRDRMRQNTRRVLSNGAPVRTEVRIQRKDGTWCWVESTSSNLLNEPDVRAIVSNYRDIGERKAAEEQMHRDAEHLARYNAELEAFAFAAAHDLKEPLRTIRAFTELLVQRTPKDDETGQMADFIVDGVSRMSLLLDDLLSFTRVSFSDAPERVALDDVLQRAIRNLDQTISENGAKVIADQLPEVEGRATHLVQVLQNLICNAIRYRSEAPPEIHVSATRSGSEWTVRIRDNGIGIAPEYHERVFGLFKRLHSRDIPGTGIGLAICRKIVAGTGGRIWVESEPGKGATFCFTAPACQD